MTYDPSDLGVINSVLRFYPEVDQLIRLVKDVSNKVHYPINSQYDLMNELSGQAKDYATEQLASSLPGGLPQRIPAWYFPIASQEDLVAKLLELRKQSLPEMGSPQHGSGSLGMFQPSGGPVRQPEPAYGGPVPHVAPPLSSIPAPRMSEAPLEASVADTARPSRSSSRSAEDC